MESVNTVTATPYTPTEELHAIGCEAGSCLLRFCGWKSAPRSRRRCRVRQIAKAAPSKRGRPSTISNPRQLEGQVVVGILKRPWEILEVRTRGSTRGSRLCASGGRRPTPSRAFSVEVASAPGPTPATEHQ
jgi:hypothetical protein